MIWCLSKEAASPLKLVRIDSHEKMEWSVLSHMRVVQD
jgi:hypothetical protein